MKALNLNTIKKFIDKYKVNTILLSILVLLCLYLVFKPNPCSFIEVEKEVTTNKTPTKKDSFVSISQPSKKIFITDNIKIGGQPREFKSTRETTFISGFIETSKVESKKFGIPVSVKIAQAAVESGWGKSSLAIEANNYYGLKYKKSYVDIAKINGISVGKYKKKSKEYVKGRWINKTSTFLKYKSRWDCIRHHSLVLQMRSKTKYNKGYAKMVSLTNKDYKGWCKALQQAGYGTDPQYSDKVIKIIDRYNLSRFD